VLGLKKENLMKKKFLLMALAVSVSAFAADMSADFSQETGVLRRSLHSSGFAPKSVSAGNLTELIKELNFEYTRTHDHALVNVGQRIIDTHFLFPLMHLDAKDPRNYYFKATDYFLDLSRKAGLKIFYRLGTSIEHSGDKYHFNTLIPEDFDKTAEIYAGIIRHYNRGWGDGYYWDIKYWEIWNEPDGVNNMWCLPDGDCGIGETQQERKIDFDNRNKKRRELFIELFVKCLKRIKSEFPDVKVGGPAMCTFRPSYFKDLLKACKDHGVAPDFISWHYYGSDPNEIIRLADQAREVCDSFGFKDCELIINEWHYLGSYNWSGLRNDAPEVVKKVWEGPASHNGIDSSCFTLSTMAKMQTSKYDHSFFYGCSHTGAWGYMDSLRQKYKIWYALKLYGSIMKDYKAMCASSGGKTVETLAAKSKDGKTGALLVVDYLGKDDTLTLKVKGVKNVMSATLLDHERNNENVDVEFVNGKLTLKKKIPGSTAFLVKFEL
jgi:hypothetical protein